MDQTIIGYDVRLSRDMAAVNWNEKRRREYLLRTDIRCPLSVDIDVWPSLFEFEASRRSDGKLLIARPSIRQQALGLWENWKEMLRQFRSSADRSMERRACAVCITVLSGEGGKSEFLKAWAPTLGLASQPEPIEASWEFLGFDVADRNLLSGLSNCGYDETEGAVVRANWANKLNDDGLFFDGRDALAFRELSDTRCIEHGPFGAFGLFSVPLNEAA